MSALPLLNNLIKTFSVEAEMKSNNNQSDRRSNIISVAKYLNLNQKLLVRQLRKTIGDVLIMSNDDYPEEIYKKMDDILIQELKHKNIVKSEDVSFILNNNGNTSQIKLCRGDITTLKIGAIVNAANTKGLGCFVANHKCIDNVIHRGAGPRLRKECREILGEQPFLSTGTAIITNGYCLPCKYIIHTPGPIGEKPKLLKQCYISVLNLCKKHKIKTVAFCCISTGLFGYPQESAAKVAISSVRIWLARNRDAMDYVVFNVFTAKDLAIYTKLL